MNIVKSAHSQLISPRRTRVLAKHLASLIPKDSTVLDIGCGDGLIDKLIMNLRSDLKIVGVDILKREKTFIPVRLYDGKRLPFLGDQFDCVMYIDTLHHTADIENIILDGKRVSKKNILIKDHYANNKISSSILKFMDWVGNKFYAVNLTYNYLSETEWKNIYNKLGLKKQKEINKLGLYPFPFDLIFENCLHFISLLTLE